MFLFVCVEVEESLDLRKLNHWLSEMKETIVSVQLPRFKVEESFSLKEKLQAMGLTDLFSSEKASLPGTSVYLSPKSRSNPVQVLELRTNVQLLLDPLLDLNRVPQVGAVAETGTRMC